MRRLVRSVAALNDIAEIWWHISADSVNAADQIVDELTLTFEKLSRFPGLGRVRLDIDPMVRPFPFKRYVILYGYVGETLEIYRVVHSARNLPDLLNDET